MYAVLEEKLDVLRAMLHGFDYSGFLTAGHGLLAKAANHVLEIKGGRFADAALAMSKAFSLCCALDEAKAVREEVAFFQAVKVLLTKRDLSQKKQTMRNVNWQSAKSPVPLSSRPTWWAFSGRRDWANQISAFWTTISCKK